MTSKQSGFTEEFTCLENGTIKFLDDAVAETKTRAKFLYKFVKSLPRSYVTKEARDIVWKIQRCFVDWKNWRRDVASTLVDENYPETAAIIIRNASTKLSFMKDDGFHKLTKNLLGSIASFSEFPDFRQQLTKFYFIEPILAFLSYEMNKKKPKQEECHKDSSILIYGLQISLNVLSSNIPATTNEFIKHGGINVFAVLMDSREEEVKCLAALCLLRILSTKNPMTNFVDDKNANQVFINVLTVELAGSGDSSRQDFRIPPEQLTDGLLFLSKNDANMRKMIQNGVVRAICSLVKGPNETFQLRGIELLLALFQHRLPMAHAAIAPAEHMFLLENISSMKSSVVEVSKAKKLLATINKQQLDENDENQNTGYSSRSPVALEDEIKTLSSETLLNEDEPKDFESTFKENDHVVELDDAISETQLRLNFLENLNKLSPSSVACSEALNVVTLLKDAFSNWPLHWQPKIISIYLKEKFPVTALSYIKFLSKQDITSNPTTHSLALHLYSHIEAIINIPSEFRRELLKAGFVDVFLEHLRVLEPTIRSKRTHTSEIAAKIILIIYHVVSKFPELKSEYTNSDATRILLFYLNLPAFHSPVCMSLPHLLPDSPEAGTVCHEKGIVKALVDLATTTLRSKQQNRKFSGHFSIAEVMDTLCLLAINDSNRLPLLEYGTPGLISELLSGRNIVHQKQAIDLMWTLNHEPSGRHEFRKERTITLALKKLASSNNEELVVKARQFFDYQERLEKLGKKRFTEANHHDDKEKPGNVIYISYSDRQRSVVVSIKDVLERNGYVVSVDLSDKNRIDYIDKMTKSIETATVAIICSSYTYKINNLCRAEINFATFLSKPMIFCNMDSNYSPDGWLNIMARNCIVIDMSLEKLAVTEAATVKLVKSVRQVFENKVGKRQLLNMGIAMSPIDDANFASISKWTKADIKRWLQKEKLYQKYGSKMEDFDGEKLAVLLQLEKKAPDFYYNSVSKHFGDTLPNLLQLLSALGRLSTSLSNLNRDNDL